MKNRVLGIIMTIIGAVAAVYCGIEWYNMATGILEFYDKNGVAVAPTGYIIGSLAAAVIAVVGILILIRNKKAQQA